MTKPKRKPARVARTLTVGRVTRTITEWAAESGIGLTAIYNRLAAGWPPEQAVGIEPRPKTPRAILSPDGGSLVHRLSLAVAALEGLAWSLVADAETCVCDPDGCCPLCHTIEALQAVGTDKDLLDSLLRLRRGEKVLA